MAKKEEIFPVEVFCGTQWQVLLLKSLLDDFEIESFIKDSQMGVLAPWNVDAGGAGPLKIFVSNLDVERAMEVVNQFERVEGVDH